jgi:hypothetical protein
VRMRGAYARCVCAFLFVYECAVCAHLHSTQTQTHTAVLLILPPTAQAGDRDRGDEGAGEGVHGGVGGGRRGCCGSEGEGGDCGEVRCGVLSYHDSVSIRM